MNRIRHLHLHLTRKAIISGITALLVLIGITSGVLFVNASFLSSDQTSTVPYASCAEHQFGPDLQPLGEPASVHTYTAEPQMTINTDKLYKVTMVTTAGTMTLCLQPNLAPHTVNVIVTLIRNRFYDGLTFHRVVAGFVIQGGDPTGTGSGGPGFKFNDEPVRQAYVEGAVAMANSGANTNGSQFFICIADDSASLAPSYNLFGRVESGMDVALAIKQGDKMTSVTVQEER